MGSYDTGQVCVNGHPVNSMVEFAPQSCEKFCSECGAETVTACEECGAKIRGYYSVEGVLSIGDEWMPSNHCYECGKPYPWTVRHAEALSEAIDELDELSDDDRDKLRKSIPDIIADTPKSEIAVTRFKKAAAKVGSAGSTLIWEVVKTVATEAVKASMGLK